MGHDLIFKALEPESGEPLYVQLQRNLREAVESQALAPESMLPTERVIAETLSVSRVTVRKAVENLVAEGLLTRRQGAGTFVAGRIEKNFAKLSSFTEDMEARGRKPTSEWILRDRGSVTPDESLGLGLSPGTAVFRFHRLRMADGDPMALEYSTIPAASIGDFNKVGSSLYAALEASGHRPVRALQRLRAIPFTGEIARQLGVPDGSAGLYIERRGYLESGQTVEITQSYYRGDAYDFVAELGIGQ
ncbi:GntR family transcriptional regulator [Maricaulis sp. W15]|uniref:GntR family transcriptional regulator n=1 Tax=Maricaulis maris TaxID=74318 RepID=A0A495DEK6_9PROT|nr:MULTISPECIES: GntR family transcriptional regulator [Maricaulis]OLF73889.1 GntR family transcriptional regulator [Maricaulis sp. W15]RKR00335.1 GntR family transcriptional regulator [Maricaulis maris]